MRLGKLKRLDKVGFLTALAAAFIALAGCALGVGLPHARATQWLASSGLLFTLAGVIQLEVSGFFEKFLPQFMDESKHPYGPPSTITREIIDDPDRPKEMWARCIFFHHPRTGFWLIVVGTLIQIWAAWA